MEKKKGLNSWLVAGGIALAVVVLLVLWYVSIYNGLIRMNENVNGKWAQVETQYQRRVDLIPNIVATVEGARDFEKSTLLEITALRSQWQTASTVNQRVETANQLESAISKLLLITENYPELKTNANFLSLQDELANTENKVAVERGRYNDAVRDFNARIKTFPAKIVAGNLGYADREYFQSAEGAEEAPEISFE